RDGGRRDRLKLAGRPGPDADRGQTDHRRMRALLLAVIAAAAGAAAAAAEIAPADRRSGYDFAGPESRAMQDDDAANPGMLGVLQGETLWAAKTGAAERSCADCHGDARTSMKGVAARYPGFEPKLARSLDLEG